MRTYIESDCRVKLFDSADELIGRTRLPLKSDNSVPYAEDGFVGRSFDSIAAARGAVGILWNEGTDALDDMRRELANATLPVPYSRRRRLRWDDSNGGEVISYQSN